MFFKVLRTQPSRRRTMVLSPAAAGKRGRLHANDVAVSVHEELAAPRSSFEAASASAWLSLVAMTTEGRSSAHVLANLPQRMSFDAMTKQLLCSQSELGPRSESDAQELRYSFMMPQCVHAMLDAPEPLFERVADIATALIRAGAFLMSDSWLALPLSDEVPLLCKEGPLVQQSPGLSSHGRGDRNDNFLYQVSQAGVSRVVATDGVQDWVWKRLAQKRKHDGQQQMLAYEVGSGLKIFYSSGLAISPEYLQCLLRADDLKSQYGIQRIPHGDKQATYVNLLQGKVAPEAVSRLPTLAMEYDLSSPPPALAPPPPVSDSRVQNLADGGDEAACASDNISELFEREDLPDVCRMSWNALLQKL